jgi:hypothetical protein
MLSLKLPNNQLLKFQPSSGAQSGTDRAQLGCRRAPNEIVHNPVAAQQKMH